MDDAQVLIDVHVWYLMTFSCL